MNNNKVSMSRGPHAPDPFFIFLQVYKSEQRSASDTERSHFSFPSPLLCGGHNKWHPTCYILFYEHIPNTHLSRTRCLCFIWTHSRSQFAIRDGFTPSLLNKWYPQTTFPLQILFQHPCILVRQRLSWYSMWDKDPWAMKEEKSFIAFFLE